MLRIPNLCLASTSPRRFELLSQISECKFSTCAPDFAEDLDKAQYADPRDYVLETSYGKAKASAQSLPAENENGEPIVIVSADTVIIHDNKIYEKPRSKEDQLANLRRFLEQPVSVVTAVTILVPKVNYECRFFEETFVEFDPEADIEGYVEQGEGIDVAGGFRIQGFGATLIKRINGDYSNVVGLPLCRLNKELSRILKA